MAKTQIAENEKSAQSLSAIDLVLANHQAEDGVEELDFESDSEMMGDESQRLIAFLQSRRMKKNSNSVFLKVNNSPILGAKGEKLRGGVVPLFNGAALDLKNADILGEKKFLKPPEASGKGGMLALMPQKFNQGILLPLSSIKLKENFVEGEIDLKNRSGFHGNHIRLTAEKIHLTKSEAEFINPMLIYKTKDDESAVPIPEKVNVTDEGISPKMLTKYLRLEAPVTNDIANETVEAEETTGEAPETAEEMLESKEKLQEPDRILFRVNKGRFRSKTKKIGLGKYDSFTVEYKGGQLVAVIIIDGKPNEIELNETEAYHTYTADSITVELEDDIGIINGILGEIVDGVENDTNEICYGNLEISEDGIFFNSIIKDSSVALNINDDWDLKIGNTTELGYGGDLLGGDDDESSYFDLAKTVLQYFNIIKSDDSDEEGESEEEAEEGDNNFEYSVPLLTFPIIPGLLSIDAKFGAGAKIGYKVSGSVNNIVGALKNQQSETFGLDLKAALTGSAYAGFKAGITAGPSFLMNVSANLGAKIALTGGEDNNVLSAGVHTEFKKNRRNKPVFEKVEFDALGELHLKAILDGSIDAQILGWEKTLYSYTFKDWELAAIAAEIKAAKEKGSKWHAEASLSYSALAGKVKGKLESGDELEKMFDKQEASYGKKVFDASQSSFEDAKNMLMAYHDKSKPMFVNLKDANSGFLNMNNAIKNIQRRFYVQLRTNEETIAAQMDELESLKKDKGYKKSGEKIQSLINKHAGNIAQISKSMEELNAGSTQLQPGESQSDKIMNAYVAGGGSRGGFENYLMKKAKSEAITVDSLISYEVRRRNELTKKSNDRIAQMRAFAESLGIDGSDTTKSSELLEKYKSIGGKAVKKSNFSDITALRQYEESRITEKRSKWYSLSGNKYKAHMERVDALAEKFPDIVKNGSDAPNSEFYNYYTNILGAFNFRRNLDLFSNRERLLAFERKAAQSKLNSSKEGTAALQKRDEIRQLLALDKRDEQQQARLDFMISSGIEEMNSDKKAAYMTATTEDFINALGISEKSVALKTLIKRKIAENKENKGKKSKKWVYDAIKNDLTIDDLIEYEKSRYDFYANKKLSGDKLQKHQEKINILERKKAEAEAKRSTDPTGAEKILYDAIQEYFSFGQKGNESEGFLEDVLKKAKKGDISVQKLFMGAQWTPDESKEIKKLQQLDDGSSMYEQMREYGIKTNGKVDHDKNREALKKYLESKGVRQYTAEDLDKYYTYQIHRATAATFHSDHKADHTAVLEEIEGISDYHEMLRRYKEMGRGDSFLEHEQFEADSWVTPNMILQYERDRMHRIDQKHWDRIEKLKEAESGTDEEKAEAVKEYAASAKRYNKEGSNEGVKISLDDIIAAEEARQSFKMAIHDNRIEQLISSGTELTDEEKIMAYDGTRYEPEKEDVESIFTQLQDKISSDPAAMAEELTSYEKQEKEYQEELHKKWKQLQTDITDRLIILAEQAEQCLKVINDTENVLNDPKSVFESESSTNKYIENVLDKTQSDMTKIPDVLNSTSE